MKIGILYICTGVYDFFWKSFYLSAERYFLQEYSWNREYFVFTDSPSIYGEFENEHIHRIHQENLGWPGNTMKRFEMFLSIRNQLEDQMDYLFFFNANMEFMCPVGEDILPTEKENGLVGALHTWYFDQHKWNCPYERRRMSFAFIPYWKGKHYFQGSLLGGTTAAFLKMCDTCNRWIDNDLKNNIVLHTPKVLDCRYNYCEIRNLPVEKKIMYKNKAKYFSFEDLKRPSYSTYPVMPGKNIIKILSRVKKVWKIIF